MVGTNVIEVCLVGDYVRIGLYDKNTNELFLRHPHTLSEDKVRLLKDHLEDYTRKGIVYIPRLPFPEEEEASA